MPTKRIMTDFYEKFEKLMLEIERLKNNKNKNNSNSSKPTSSNRYKKAMNNLEKSDKTRGNHKGTTLTKEDIDKMISGEIDEIIEIEENKTKK